MMNAEGENGMCCRSGKVGFCLQGLGWGQALRSHPRARRAGSCLLPPQPFSWPYLPVHPPGAAWGARGGLTLALAYQARPILFTRSPIPGLASGSPPGLSEEQFTQVQIPYHTPPHPPGQVCTLNHSIASGLRGAHS